MSLLASEAADPRRVARLRHGSGWRQAIAVLLETGRRGGYDPSRDAAATVASLAREEPQHPPPFFLLQRIVARTLGDSVWTRRLPAALFGTASLVALFWFTLRLFGEARTALLATALAAVSPFHVVLAQTAREYSLWLLMTCVASALLCEAFRRGGAFWLAYAASCAAATWAFPLFVFVIASHAIVVLTTKRAAVLDLVGAVALTAAAFAPWAVILALNHHAVARATLWNGSTVCPFELVAKLAFNSGLTFFDLDFVDVRLALFLLPAFAIVAAGIWRLARRDRVSLTFILALGIVPIVALVVPDLVLGQNRSTAGRYLLPSWLAMELIAAGFLMQGCRSRNLGARLSAAEGIAYLLLLGLFSCAVAAQARFWWYTTTDAALAPIAAALGAQHSVTIVHVDEDYQLLVLRSQSVANACFHLGARPSARGDDDDSVLIGTSLTHGPGRLLERTPLPSMFPAQSGAVLELRRRIASGRGLDEGGVNGIELWRPRRANPAPF
jgi:uncharacterized membrane protein